MAEAMNLPGTKPNILARFAAVDECASIARVLYEAFVEYKSLYTPEAFAATTPNADHIRQRWHEGPVWVACQHDQIVGTVAAVAKGQALYIRSMALLPNARGMGIGRALLDQVETFANAGGFRQMFLSTTPFLDNAIRLYAGYGFERSSDGPRALFGTHLVTLEKTLK